MVIEFAFDAWNMMVYAITVGVLIATAIAIIVGSVRIAWNWAPYIIVIALFIYFFQGMLT